MLDIGVEHNLVEKSGSWFSYKGERIGQGRENARSFLKENKEIAARLETEVRKTLGLVAPEKAQAAAAGPNGAPHHQEAHPPQQRSGAPARR